VARPSRVPLLDGRAAAASVSRLGAGVGGARGLRDRGHVRARRRSNRVQSLARTPSRCREHHEDL